MGASVSNSIFTGNGWDAGMEQATNGDRVQASRHDSGPNPVTPPSGMSHGVDYYIVNAGIGGNPANFQLATTPGGAPIAVANAASVAILMQPSSHNRPVVGPEGSRFLWPNGDSYLAIGIAALEMAAGNNHPDFDAAFVSKFRAFWAPWRRNPGSKVPYQPWGYDGTLLETRQP
jgi:hypothetical protein